MGAILNTPIEEDIFLEDMEFGIKKLANGKSKDIESFLGMGRKVLLCLSLKVGKKHSL